MRNERAPRTLADCSWQTGYASAEFRRGDRSPWWLAVVLACGLVGLYVSRGA